MKRLRRRLFNLAAGVSLVLCIATASLWMRSYWMFDALAYLDGSGEWVTQTAPGLMVIGTTNVGHRTSRLRQDSSWGTYSIWDAWGGKSNINHVGFGHQITSVPVTSNHSALAGKDPDLIYPAAMERRLLIVPMWAIVLVFVVLPARWFFTTLRVQRRSRRNQCLACGYDLRATPDRCPECGTVPEAAKGAAT